MRNWCSCGWNFSSNASTAGVPSCHFWFSFVPGMFRCRAFVSTFPTVSIIVKRMIEFSWLLLDRSALFPIPSSSIYAIKAKPIDQPSFLFFFFFVQFSLPLYLDRPPRDRYFTVNPISKVRFNRHQLTYSKRLRASIKLSARLVILYSNGAFFVFRAAPSIRATKSFSVKREKSRTVLRYTTLYIPSQNLIFVFAFYIFMPLCLYTITLLYFYAFREF